ncbi:MAG TPA: type VI secretion system tube protein Hcp [Nitrososphaerales archaeon]|nr:type VI secretion system tube protein Hcp [Nitrososphaerales archaeon]
MEVAPALVIGLIAILAGLVVGYAGAGLKMVTQTQTTTSVDTTIQTLFSTVTTTAAIQMDASQGTPIPTGTFIGVATTGGQQTVVAKYDFTNLLVSSYSTDSHGTLPVDVVKLVFQNVTVVV